MREQALCGCAPLACRAAAAAVGMLRGCARSVLRRADSSVAAELWAMGLTLGVADASFTIARPVVAGRRTVASGQSDSECGGGDIRVAHRACGRFSRRDLRFHPWCAAAHTDRARRFRRRRRGGAPVRAHVREAGLRGAGTALLRSWLRSGAQDRGIAARVRKYTGRSAASRARLARRPARSRPPTDRHLGRIQGRRVRADRRDAL